MSFFMEIYTIFETGRQLCGLIVNLLLVYCILMKSPASIASYSVLLLNSALTDLTTCFVHLFVQPRIMIVGQGAYFISYGFCVVIGYKSCIIGYNVMILLYGHFNLSQLGSFLYRWYFLHFKTPSKRLVFLFVLLIASPTVALFAACSIPLIANAWGQDYKDVVLRQHPEEVTSTISTFGIPDANNSLLGAIINYWVLCSVIPISIIVFFLRWRIMLFLGGQVTLSAQNKKMQMDILNALSVQAVLSLLYLIGTFVSIPGKHLFSGAQVFLEISLFLFCGFTPFLAPFITLYFIVPYRKCVHSLLGHIDVPLASTLIHVPR